MHVPYPKYTARRNPPNNVTVLPRFHDDIDALASLFSSEKIESVLIRLCSIINNLGGFVDTTKEGLEPHLVTPIRLRQMEVLGTQLGFGR